MPEDAPVTTAIGGAISNAWKVVSVREEICKVDAVDATVASKSAFT